MITRPTTGSLHFGLETVAPPITPPLAIRITLTTGRLSLGTVAPTIKPPVQPPVVDFVRCPTSSQQWFCVYREGHSGPHSKTPKPRR